MKHRCTFIGLSFSALLALALTGCQVRGLTDGYNYLSSEDQAQVVYQSQGGTGSLHMVSAEYLRSQLAKDSLNVVWLYHPGCTAESCIPPAEVVAKTPQHVKLTILTYLLDHSIIELSKHRPIYGMDRYQYKTGFIWRVRRAFFRELLGRDERDDDTGFFLFQGDKFVRTIPLDELSTL